MKVYSEYFTDSHILNSITLPKEKVKLFIYKVMYITKNVKHIFQDPANSKTPQILCMCVRASYMKLTRDTHLMQQFIYYYKQLYMFRASTCHMVSSTICSSIISIQPNTPKDGHIDARNM